MTTSSGKNQKLLEENFFLKQKIKQLEKSESDSKRDKDSLMVFEEHYRLLANNIPDIIYSLDGEGNILAVNSSAFERYGFNEKDAMGRPFLDFVHLEDREILINSFLKAMEDKRKFTTGLQFRIVAKDGISYWFELNAHARFDSHEYYTGEDGVLRDITDRKQTEVRLQSTLNSLRKAVSITIQVLVSAVETRDPYTAGHQRRVANLARAIATEMGLPPEKIDGIRMAGSIHDIGKLSIPSEILTKPTKLSELEYSMIKEHAVKGYEILKDVESPWRLAEIVYQHHERMDGSGYPNKLQGKEILTEARILCVADVVEAMASDRPYRPSLGIDVALNEIEKNRGIYYDAAAADACLRIFHEKGFNLEGIDYK